jgi:hypothetical protein
MKTDQLPRAIRNILARRRGGRVRYMLSKVALAPKMNVIDIGCGPDGRSFEDHVPSDWTITGIDILPKERVRHTHRNFSYFQQSGHDLRQFDDGQFDLAVSIGMLEHITDESTFRGIVSEIRRVAKQYIVVVPYKYCWIEPHFGVPFFPLLPYQIKVALVKAFNLSNQREKVAQDPDFIRRHYRWLSNSEYKAEFQDSRIFLMPTLETIAITRRAPA